MNFLFIRKNTRGVFTLTTVLLILSTLACNAAGLAPRMPAQTVAPSPEALQSFKDKWRNLSMATPNGPFTVTFTEAELTSAVDAAVREAQADSGETIPVQNVQVFLRDGVIDAYGQAALEPLTVTGHISMTPGIGPDGQVNLTILQVDFGPLEVDESMLDQLMTTVESSINEPIQTSPLNITLTDITIAEGQITINGTITP